MSVWNDTKIADWTPSQLAKFIQQTIFTDPPPLPPSIILDSLSVIGDTEIGGVLQAGQGVATTVGTLFPPAPRPGQIHLFQAGNNPYVHELMVYDHKQGQWVSAQSRSAFQIGAWTEASTFPQPAGNTKVGRITVQDAGIMWDAGLRPQMRISSRFNNGTPGNIARVGCSMYEANDGETGLSLVEGTSASITVTGTTMTYKYSGWVEFSTTPTNDHLVFVATGGPNSGGTCTYQETYFEVRWVKSG